ncbi:HEAT repeat domain-containing protein [Nocardia sp. NPDC059180]|uniref:HEAT repeat domain-containing protein n=1 Tax=Nocardia sp. NPDC059180 TaxID=3346761 RepID=UPI0036BBC72C
MHTTKVYGEIGIDNDLYKNLTDPDFSVRHSVFRVLADRYNSYASTERFATQLPVERKQALRVAFVRALAERQDGRTAQALIRVLDDDTDEVREIAARTLGEIGNAAAIGPLRAVRSDPVATVRFAVISALAALQDTATINTLLASFDESVPEPDRMVIVHAAGSWIEPTTSTLLSGIAANDGSAAVRKSAERVLDLHAKAADCASEVRPELADVLLDPTAPGRPVIAEALSQVRDPAFDAIFAAVLGDRDVRIHRAALGFLRHADTAVARRGLVAGLVDKRSHVCAEVLEVVETIDHPEMTGALRDMLRTTPPALSWYLMSCLAIQRTQRDLIADEVTDYVLGQAQWFGGPKGPGLSAGWAVVDARTERVLTRLLAEITDSDLSMDRRGLATTILRELVTPRTRSKHDLPVLTMVEPITVALRDPAYDSTPSGRSARENLVFILGELGTESVRRPLLDLLGSPELAAWELEVVVARCAPDFVGPFLRLLDNPSCLAPRNRPHSYKTMLTALYPFLASDPHVESCVRRFFARTDDPDAEMAASMLGWDLRPAGEDDDYEDYDDYEDHEDEDD